MRYDGRAKPWKATDKGGSRGLNHVHYNATKSRLEASDGRIALLLPVEASEDDGGPIPKEALERAHKNRDKKSSATTLVANGSVTAQGLTVARPDDEVDRFPDFDTVDPEHHNSSFGSMVHEVTLDPIKLRDLLDAMGALHKRAVNGVQFRFYSEGGPVRIELLEENGIADGKPIVGLIMPITTS